MKRNMSKLYLIIGLLLLGIIVLFVSHLSDSESELSPYGDSVIFFNDSYVHEVSIFFDDDNWYSTLYSNHNDEDDPYESASVLHEDTELYMVGVRFKGASSFTYEGIKKSFKIDVNEFFENCNIYDDLPECDDLKFYDLQKINFDNSYKDPSFLREKLLFDIAGKYFPTVRTVFTKLNVNEEYIGLYTSVEQPDKNFIEMNYGDNDGNLFECEKNSGDGAQSTFGSDLSYLGEDKDDYKDYYELKFGDKSEAWDDLIHFTDVLNNYNDSEFEEEIDNIADVDQFLYMLAINNIFANYDSYTGSQHNYYVYEDSEGIFHPILWDGNEAFGSFSQNAPSDQMRADIFYGDGVLENRFYNIPKYKDRYIEIVKNITSNYFNVDYMNKTITSYVDLIRDSVYSDSNKMYTDEEFEDALYYSNDEDASTTSKSRGGQQSGSSILEFVDTRYESIMSSLEEYEN